MGFQNAHSPETGRKQIFTHYRPTPHEQVLQLAQTNMRDTQASQEPDAHRRLDGLRRSNKQLLHTRHHTEEDRDFFTVNYGGTQYRLADGMEVQHLIVIVRL
jgi:hypothetical protein